MAHPRRRGRQEDCWIVWPCYFDARLSRKQGRRVSKEMAVKNPKLEELAEAIKSIGLKATQEAKAAHPTSWFSPSGKLKVTYPGERDPKEELLKKMGQHIKELRRDKQT